MRSAAYCEVTSICLRVERQQFGRNQFNFLSRHIQKMEFSIRERLAVALLRPLAARRFRPLGALRRFRTTFRRLLTAKPILLQLVQ